MKTMRCEQCASTDLRRVGEGEYVCNHCAARMERAPSPAPPIRRAATGPQTPHSLPRRVLSWVVILAAVCAVAGLRYQRSERLADERRRRAIQRSVAASLASHFGPASGRPAPASGPESRGQPATEYSGAAVVAPKVVTASFTDAVALPDSIGNLYFVGLYKNTGEAAIERPRVEVTLWDAGKHKLAVAQGYSSGMALVPGAEIPIKILVQHAPVYDSVTYKVEPEAMHYGSPRNFELHLENPLLQPDSFSGYRLTGSVTNKDKDPAKFVQVIALLLGSGKQIIGMQEGYVAQQVLPAGDSCPFNIRFTLVNGKPASFKLYTSAMLAQK
jgi:hypothetical protein